MPVVSLNGTPLMPCKLAKALKLLSSGKAFLEDFGFGRVRLRLRFNPKSRVYRGVDGVRLFPRFLVELRRLALKRGVFRRVLSFEDRALAVAFLRFGHKPKSPRVVDALARIVVRVRAALAGPLMRLM